MIMAFKIDPKPQSLCVLQSWHGDAGMCRDSSNCQVGGHSTKLDEAALAEAHLCRAAQASLALSSVMISYARWILMNSSAAFLLPGCLSGCFSSTNFLYLCRGEKQVKHMSTSCLQYKDLPWKYLHKGIEGIGEKT